jgi:hypothetical protein
MNDCFYPAYATGRQYSLAHIDNLLICYRYWKETRNSIAHAGGRATARLVAEDSRLTALTPESIGVSRVPRLAPVTMGDQIELELENVLGFGEILHRIAVTVDAELSAAQAAEDIMIARFESVRRHHYSDPSSRTRPRESYLKNQMRGAGMRTPYALSTLDAFLSARFGTYWRVA